MTLGGAASDALSLSCWWWCWADVAVHTEQLRTKEKKAELAGQECTISPWSVAMGFLEGKQGGQVATLGLLKKVYTSKNTVSLYYLEYIYF